MKKIAAYIFILHFTFAPQWHTEEWKALASFFQNAYEHLASGDSLAGFLNKHYGEPQNVIKHYQKKHPDKKPFEKKHHDHDLHLTDLALLFFPLELPKSQDKHMGKIFSYYNLYSCPPLIKFPDPPELV